MSLTAHAFARVLTFAVLFAAAMRPVAAEMAVETIVLRYRTAEQVLPLLAPHVAKPGTVSGAGSELVVRTSATNLAELRRIVAGLDRAPRRLMVTVRQDAAADEHAGGARSYGTRSADGDRSVQQVQVLEGREASVRIGQSVPVTLRGSVRRGVGAQVVFEPVDTVAFRDILSGFTVTPRVTGDTVVLDISPQDDMPGAQGRGSIDLRRIATTLAGRLGEWIEVGAIAPAVPPQGDVAVHSTRSASATARRILVKVEAID